MKDQTRVYPSACTSAFCGRLECPEDCPRLPALADFKAWREATQAVVADRVWCPNVYTATR